MERETPAKGVSTGQFYSELRQCVKQAQDTLCMSNTDVAGVLGVSLNEYCLFLSGVKESIPDDASYRGYLLYNVYRNSWIIFNDIIQVMEFFHSPLNWTKLSPKEMLMQGAGEFVVMYLNGRLDQHYQTVILQDGGLSFTNLSHD